MASIDTETGPTSATDFFSAVSLPLSTSTHPLTFAAILESSNVHLLAYKMIHQDRIGLTKFIIIGPQ